jgi:hypothetical protein
LALFVVFVTFNDARAPGGGRRAAGVAWRA